MHETPLYRLIDGAVRRAVPAEKTAVTPKEGGEAFARKYATLLNFPQGQDVLLQFWRHARPERAHDPARRYLAQQAVSWLSGEEIDDEPARTLGLKVDGQGSVMLKDDHEIEQVLLILARLAQFNDQPFVLCIDQGQSHAAQVCVPIEHVDPLPTEPDSPQLQAIDLFDLVKKLQLTFVSQRGQTEGLQPRKALQLPQVVDAQSVGCQGEAHQTGRIL